MSSDERRDHRHVRHVGSDKFGDMNSDIAVTT